MIKVLPGIKEKQHDSSPVDGELNVALRTGKVIEVEPGTKARSFGMVLFRDGAMIAAYATTRARMEAESVFELEHVKLLDGRFRNKEGWTRSSVLGRTLVMP